MSKNSSNKFIDTIDECLTNGVKNGIFQVSLEDNSLDGRNVTIGGREVVNFGSCSYLGLEVDERLKQGAIDATIRYGTQYSSSRAYSACNLYEEMEDLFYKIFDNTPAILAATTTLTHVSAIPILVQNDDLVILDHQVHGSVQLAVQLTKARGTQVEMIRHNRMDILEDLIKKNPNKYNKIWYMADGLYSMYGDYAPLKDIVFLMEKYANFHLYIDDAHGMSWTGKHGNGYVLSQMPMHPKMVLSTSLAKGFGTGGGVLVLSDKEMRRKILTCGSSYTFSGPVQPPMLGASIASAKIHLTDEIYELQNKLKAKIKLTSSIINKHDLPLAFPSNSPIFYIGLGLPRVGYNMVKRLLNEGFFTNIGIFPGVPVNCTGLRLPITNGQTDDDIIDVLAAFQHHFPLVLEEEGLTVDKLSQSFKMPFEKTKKRYPLGKKEEAVAHNTFDIQHETTIQNIDKTLWDNLLGDNGTFDWEGCKFLEETFTDNPEPENNWEFHYLVIKDENKKPILATFFTELLCKDDMIAPASISQQIEEARKKEKYYLTSKVVMMGSLLTEGDHLYIDKTHNEWQHALRQMIRIMNDVRLKCDASMVQLRDMDSTDVEMREFLIKEGFIKVEMPDTHIIENLNWNTEEEFLQTLSSKSRIHQRKRVLKKQSLFNFRINSKIEEDTISEKVNLYKQVKDRGYEINTFGLPDKFFHNINKYDSWEIIELFSNKETNSELLAFGICYKSPSNNYIPFVLGLNYGLNSQYGSYRQLMLQAVKRAAVLKAKKLYFGFGADIEKHKFGSRAVKKSVFIQANDNFNMELLSTLYQGPNLK